MPYVWGEFWSDEELEDLSDQINKLASKWNGNMERVKEAVRTVEQAKRNNPRGLAF
jgi:prophage DNA circulation protein